ncbi:MAG: capsular polysaccharide biosynthesis protein [Clostridia bacterium]|nr:capsular polysaccharide biosynthesis protein [Clostridia bacterium]
MMDRESKKGVGVIDFHSHMIPGIDDGSSTPDESIEMLRSSAEQGVTAVVFTPHFYATHDTYDHFIDKRKRCLSQLAQEGGGAILPVRIGAEVAYFEGITAMEELPGLRISGSRCLLLEMPFQAWTKRVIDEVISLNRDKNFQIVIAHIERHLRYFSDDMLYTLLNQGVMIQSNAEFFSTRSTRRRALRMLGDGQIHLLGTDCHNMTTRPPNMQEALQVISEKFGDGMLKEIYLRGVRVLRKDGM